MKPKIIFLLMAMTAIFLGGCTTRTPTIAHVHIGHAVTGWHDTPGKKGLFVTAENLAEKSLASAQTAATGNLDLQEIKKEIARVNRLTSSGQSNNRYGLKEALTEAVSHISYAATSKDATANVTAFSAGFAKKAGNIVDRCDLITALSLDIRSSQSLEEVHLLTPEIMKLARANVQGEDLDGDGVPGGSPGEYGLAQLRDEIENMIAREDPPYSTVPRWYLFNLIRLPDGSWMFRKRLSMEHEGQGGGY